MTSVEELRKEWQEWAERASLALGALLAETIGRAPPDDPVLWDAVQHIIDAESELAYLGKE